MKNKILCPNPTCPQHLPRTRRWELFAKNGSFVRRHSGQRIKRFRCKLCGRTVSKATHSILRGQKKTSLNKTIHRYLCSGVSQRRCAFLLGINRKTVVRKLLFLAAQARKSHQKFLASLSPQAWVQFDDMESFEHSKCKPLSITLAVIKETRHILDFQVSQMPAKGHLAEISRKKYGPRKDRRPKAWDEMFERLRRVVRPEATFTSDSNPHYPKWVAKHFPKAQHKTVKGRRGCIVGQGELKKTGFDPLFPFNHTAAMCRANINRLFRKTWCTTKIPSRLADHVMLYVQFHNELLIKSSPPRRP